GRSEAELFVRENKKDKDRLEWQLRSSQAAPELGIEGPATGAEFVGIVGEAATALERKQAMPATSTQNRAFGVMRDIARLLDPRNKKEKLKQALGDLNKAIKEQEQVAEKSKALKDPKEDNRELETEQADVVIDTDLVNKDLQNLVPEATENLDKAIDNQQEAREALKDTSVAPKEKGETAVVEQQEAIENMVAAREAIEKELEELKKKENQPQKNSIQSLEELKKKIAELKEAEKKIKNESAKAEQAPEPSAEQKKAAEQAEKAAKKAAEQAKQIASHLDQVLEKAPEEVKPAAEIAANAAEEIAKTIPEIQKDAETGNAKIDEELKQATEQLEEAAK
ncbi:uncharacterized protein METZ01_LOCUS330368, partial [marine metagenome]